MKIDLHMHSTASDGTDAPQKVAQRCAQNELEYAVLTDHDTIAGSAVFQAEAQKLGIRTTTGVEFSANSEGELHILVYGADTQNAEFCALMAELAQKRNERVTKMTQRLMDCGCNISHDQVRRYAENGVPGRPHIALALVESGEAASVDEAFERYLKVGCLGYVPRRGVCEERILAVGRAAGGLPVLAHPKLTYAPDFDALIHRLKEEGLAGIEAFYPKHEDAECVCFCALAEKYGLFVTQGSDYHGVLHPSVYLGKEGRGQGHPLLLRGIREIFEKKRG